MNRKFWRIVVPLVSVIFRQSTGKTRYKPQAQNRTRMKVQTVRRIKAAGNIKRLARQKKSGVMVRSRGKVIKILPDDNIGDRHQRFILKLNTGNTILIAHNIDIAPRVPVSTGNVVQFLGQYEWNDRGGVVHWTHHDPAGWRTDGWLKYGGKKYQ